MQDVTFPKQMTQNQRSGFYLRVLEEGLVGAGDSIEQVKVGAGQISVKTVFHLATHNENPAMLAQVAELETLPIAWREWFIEKSEKLLISD